MLGSPCPAILEHYDSDKLLTKLDFVTYEIDNSS